MKKQDTSLNVLNNPSAPTSGMNRRQMVQRLATAMSAGVTVPGMAATHPAHKHLLSASTLAAAEHKAAAAEEAPEFLDAHQIETLTALAERIVPGSTGAQVPQFIDLLLSVDTQQHQQNFLAALSAFDAAALASHNLPFKSLTEDQQNAILTQASTGKSGGVSNFNGWWFSVPSKHEGAEPTVTMRDHFQSLKIWVSSAYYSSETGMKELGWNGQVMWPSFPNCEHPDGQH